MPRNIIKLKPAPVCKEDREALAHMVHDTLHRGLFDTGRARRRWRQTQQKEARS